MSIDKKQRVNISEKKLCKETDALPEPYREVVRLFFQEGEAIKDISKKMKIPLYRAKNILSKGLYLIKKQSGDSEYEKAKGILYKKITCD